MCQNGIVDFMKREQDVLKSLLNDFNGEMAVKVPDKTQRLNRNSPTDPNRSLRLAMQLRYNLIKSFVDLHFKDSPEKIGIDKILLKTVSEILNHN